MRYLRAELVIVLTLGSSLLAGVNSHPNPPESVAGLMLTQGKLALVTDSQDTSLLREAAHRVGQITRDIQTITHLSLTDSLTIFFINNQRNVKQFIPNAPTWSGGLTTDLNTLYIYDDDPVDWGTTLRHELTHVLVAQNSVNLPVWFNEGLAQYIAGNWSWSGFYTLGTATISHDVIPLKDLDMVLSYSRKRAELGYAEAIDAFKYMLDRQGPSILPEILKAGKKSFAERYGAATRESLPDFEIGWRKHLDQKFAFFKLAHFPDLLWLAMPFLVLIGYILNRRRNKQKLLEWELEEEWRDRRGMLD